ncbi:hypothetical protein, partial [Pseudonocardia oceani]|uniref:hypothetical protein n=1 Tax=Pseudonocardia oceani TaxID=2792013 RepID=UPI001C4A4852
MRRSGELVDAALVTGAEAQARSVVAVVASVVERDRDGHGEPRRRWRPTRWRCGAPWPGYSPPRATHGLDADLLDPEPDPMSGLFALLDDVAALV